MNDIAYKYKVTTEVGNIFILHYFVNRLDRIEMIEIKEYQDLADTLLYITTGRDSTVKAMQRKGCKVKEIKVNTAHQKIALWCELYKERYGINYKVQNVDISSFKTVEVTVDLINLFFDIEEWWSKEKTISRYSKYINELKRISSGAAKSASGKNTGTAQQNRTDLAAEFERRFGNE